MYSEFDTNENVEIVEDDFDDEYSDSGEEPNENAYLNEENYVEEDDEIEVEIDSIVNIITLYDPNINIPQMTIDIIDYLDGKIQARDTEYMKVIAEIADLMGDADPKQIMKVVDEIIQDGPIAEILNVFEENNVITMITNAEQFDMDIADVLNGKRPNNPSDVYYNSLLTAVDILAKHGFTDEIRGLGKELLDEIAESQKETHFFTEEDDINATIIDIMNMLISRGYSKNTVKLITNSSHNENNYYILDNPVTNTQTLALIILRPNSGAGASDLTSIVETIDSTRFIITDILIISDKKPTHNDVRDLNDGIATQQHTILTWHYTPLSIVITNPTNHIDYDKHVKLSRSEAAEIVNSHKGNIDKFPILRLNDPICVYLGFRVGNLIKIERTDPRTGKESEPAYRLVAS